jgi:phosphoglycolate phosphatase
MVLPMSEQIAMLFDLDGTLVHSSPDLAKAANRMLTRLGLPGASESKVESWIGHGVTQLVHRCLTGEHDGRADEHLVEHALEIFRSEYLGTGFDGTRLLDGGIEVLDALIASGFPCALVTNKPLVPTLAVLEKFDLMSRFESVVCGNTLRVSKPAAAPLHHALGVCETSRGWMVGDSETDSAASAAAGLPFIALRGGYGREADPDAFPLRPALLLDALGDLLDENGLPIEMLSRPEDFS